MNGGLTTETLKNFSYCFTRSSNLLFYKPIKGVHLCVLAVGSFQAMAASHLVEGGDFLSDHVADLGHD